MNPAPAKRHATYADVLAAPEHLVAELIGGDLVTQPRPSPRHSVASASLSGELTGPFQSGRGGPGGWVFMVEPELHLGENVVVPDLAAWRRERLTAMPEEAFMTLPPDWVCEVLSPSTELWDRGPKRRIYAGSGIGHLWLVDPRSKFIEAFGLVDGHWLLPGATSDTDAAEVSLAPFDAISFPLAALWPLDPPLAETQEA